MRVLALLDASRVRVYRCARCANARVPLTCHAWLVFIAVVVRRSALGASIETSACTYSGECQGQLSIVTLVGAVLRCVNDVYTASGSARAMEHAVAASGVGSSCRARRVDRHSECRRPRENIAGVLSAFSRHSCSAQAGHAAAGAARRPVIQHALLHMLIDSYESNVAMRAAIAELMWQCLRPSPLLRVGVDA